MELTLTPAKPPATPVAVPASVTLPDASARRLPSASNRGVLVMTPLLDPTNPPAKTKPLLAKTLPVAYESLISPLLAPARPPKVTTVLSAGWCALTSPVACELLMVPSFNPTRPPAVFQPPFDPGNPLPTLTFTSARD